MMFKILVVLSLTFYVSSGIDTPIIGILSQETYIISNVFKEEHHDSFIAASYVKYLESAGARVIPVWIGQPEDYYRRVVRYTNGILFPGGGTYFNETGGYGEAALHIYQAAVKANERGVYYPIWGSCLGMQVLAFAALNGTDIRVDCILRDRAIPLNFTEGFKKSKLFSAASKDILNILRTENVTYNYHRYCLTKKVLEDHKLLADWKILSTDRDQDGNRFISSMEHRKYPIYGVQYHPEKNLFEFTSKQIPHTNKAIKASQYLADFFVEESRKNNNTFPTAWVEERSLIYNYSPRYTGAVNGSSYEQIYIFNKTTFADVQLH